MYYHRTQLKSHNMILINHKKVIRFESKVRKTLVKLLTHAHCYVNFFYNAAQWIKQAGDYTLDGLDRDKAVLILIKQEKNNIFQHLSQKS